MSEILTIRLSSDPQESIPWLVWSPSLLDVVDSGEVTDVHELTEYTHEREVIVLADSSVLTLTSVGIPAGSERQLETVLPFLLEDELAQDVMQVHVALLDKKDGRAQVAVIEHKQLEYWLAMLADAEIAPKRVIPDCLCLPLREGEFSTVELNGKWLLRSGELMGGAAEESWLPIWLYSLNENDENPGSDSEPNVISYSGLPNIELTNWHVEQTNNIMALLAQGAVHSHINILTGRYKPQNQIAKHLKPWLSSAIMAGLLFVVWGAESIVRTIQANDQVAVYKEQTRDLVKDMFPDNKRIPSTSFMKRLYTDDIKRLSTTDTNVGYLPWLAELAPMIRQANGIQLDAIRYDKDRGEMRLNMRGKDFADFEKLRETFSQKFKTELGRLNRDDKMVTGAFVLERKS